MISVDEALHNAPLIAILRGVTPLEILEVAEALYSAGVRALEVPLNSPDPLQSIAKLHVMGDRLAYGAGTVLRSDDVDAVAAAGGQLIISPNTNPSVVRRAIACGLTPMPGFGSATEAFTAMDCGARYLKLFPASTYGAGHLRALKAVLPPDVVVQPVGGVRPEDFAPWWAVGARGFGLGSELYKPGFTAEQVHTRAVTAMNALRDLT